jgi:hypothetical protein
MAVNIFFSRNETKFNTFSAKRIDKNTKGPLRKRQKLSKVKKKKMTQFQKGAVTVEGSRQKSIFLFRISAKFSTFENSGFILISEFGVHE